MYSKLTRRNFLKSAGTLGAAVLTGQFVVTGQEKPAATDNCVIGEEKLNRFSSKVRSGGVPPDGIPSIDKPQYVPADEAGNTLQDVLSDSSVVFGVDYNGFTAAYPQPIMVWHEIVNEEIQGERVSITYCPLTGSAIGFKGEIANSSTTFGTSGKLLNSNLVMYDRLSGTNSYWPQILGKSIRGPHFGDRLEYFPVIWTTWQRWRKKHPGTSILTTDTGHIKSYARDPYGSYEDGETYYQQGDPMFEVMAKDDRFPPKKVVTGIRVKDCGLAVPKNEFRSLEVVNTKLGGEPIVVVYEQALDTIRAFSRDLDGKTREFELANDQLVSQPDGTVWSRDGKPQSGPLSGKHLETIPFFDVMWFAWYADFPDTEVLEV